MSFYKIIEVNHFGNERVVALVSNYEDALEALHDWAVANPGYYYRFVFDREAEALARYADDQRRNRNANR